MPRYRILQPNPRTGNNLRTDLENPGWWRLTRFKDPRKHIHIGDRIVVWQVQGNSPEAAGVYAIGEIIREPVRVHGTWQGWYRLSRVRDLPRPIPPKLLRADPLLHTIPAIRRPAQGSNFEITDAQWQRIVSCFGATTGNAKSTAILVPINETARSAQTAIVPASESREIKLRERRLVQSYQRYLRGRGSSARAYRISLSDGIFITCDLYDEKRGNLIEAKSVVDRSSLRHGNWRTGRLRAIHAAPYATRRASACSPQRRSRAAVTLAGHLRDLAERTGEICRQLFKAAICLNRGGSY
jgi:hypothetical protein